ncbi:MAG: hypothetical protein A3G34_09525 [Candidatus Lindowbacteria bacterium RIFCSPLOWO2_12_FULL_62_27]|nr:MAG: hypothetical protein A3G34_09525 [Candidatus Lindowbacteria bacterium RIFCSPLOWO2_12_FULL_62_27]
MFQALLDRGAVQGRPLAQYGAQDTPRLLLVITTSFGDLVASTAALEVLRQTFPKAVIGVMGKHPFETVLKDDPRVNALIPYWGKYRRVCRTRRMIREGRFDTALLLNMNDPDVIPLLYVSGVRCFVRMPGRTTIYRRICANQNDLGTGIEGEHMYEAMDRIVRYFGLSLPSPQPVLRPSPAAQDQARRFLDGAGLAGKRLVAVHPGASIPAKAWSEGRFAEFIRFFHERRPDDEILLTGAPAETGKCERIARRCGAPVRVVTSELDLPAFAALFSHLSLFIGGDSGAFHLAQAFQIPGVILYFQTPVFRTRPLPGAGRYRILQASGAVTRHGVDAIEPADVVAAAMELQS